MAKLSTKNKTIVLNRFKKLKKDLEQFSKMLSKFDSESEINCLVIAAMQIGEKGQMSSCGVFQGSKAFFRHCLLGTLQKIEDGLLKK